MAGTLSQSEDLATDAGAADSSEGAVAAGWLGEGFLGFAACLAVGVARTFGLTGRVFGATGSLAETTGTASLAGGAASSDLASVAGSFEFWLEPASDAAGSATGAALSCFGCALVVGALLSGARSEMAPDVAPSPDSGTAGLPPPRIAKNPATAASSTPPTTKGRRFGLCGA